MSRDFQKSKVYSAEDSFNNLLDLPITRVELSGVTLQLEGERKFTSLAEIQAYVTGVISHPEVIAMFGHRGMVHVRNRKGEGKAVYESRQATIALNTTMKSKWAMRESVVLHELAHHFSPGAHHGPAFTVAFTELMSIIIGPQSGLALRIIFDNEGVK